MFHLNILINKCVDEICQHRTLKLGSCHTARADQPHVTIARSDQPRVTIGHSDQPRVTIARSDQPRVTIANPPSHSQINLVTPLPVMTNLVSPSHTQTNLVSPSHVQTNLYRYVGRPCCYDDVVGQHNPLEIEGSSVFHEPRCYEEEEPVD